jgi:DNA-binding beta-propeller fold protein YncE
MIRAEVSSILLGVVFGCAAALMVSPARADLLVGNFFSPELDVLRFDQSGAFVGTFVPTGSGGLTFPLGGAFGPDGNFYVSDSDHDKVLRFNGATGAFIGDFSSAEDAAGLAFGPDQNLYVANSTSPGSVTEFNGTTGALIGDFVTPGSGGISSPEGLVFGPGGNLYVASADTSSVLEYNGTTGAFITAFASGNGLSNPRGLTFGPDGNLYVGNFGGGPGAVLRFNGTTGAFIDNFVAAGSGGVSLPRGLVFGPDGDLYVASYGSGDILRYDGSTGASLGAFAAAGSGGLGGPTFLVFHDFSATSTVPEPSSLALLAAALMLCVACRQRARLAGIRPAAT